MAKASFPMANTPIVDKTPPAWQWLQFFRSLWTLLVQGAVTGNLASFANNSALQDSGIPAGNLPISGTVAGDIPTFSNTTGALQDTGQLNWTPPLYTITNPNGNSEQRLNCKAGSASQISMADGGNVKWYIGKDAANNWFLFDQVSGANVISAAHAGTVTIAPGGGTTNINGVAGASITVLITSGETGQSSSPVLELTNTQASAPFVSFLVQSGSGTYNPLAVANDAEIIFSHGTVGTGTLTIAPHSSTATGIRIDGGAKSIVIAGSFSPSNDAKATQAGSVYQGSGVPNNANGNNGDVYFRTDTPGTVNQRIYVRSAGAWIGIL